MRKYMDLIINLSNRNKNWKVIKILIWEKKYNLMRRNKKDSKIDELLKLFLERVNTIRKIRYLRLKYSFDNLINQKKKGDLR